MRATTISGKRLERIAKGAQAVVVARAEAASQKRRALIATWNIRTVTPDSYEGISEEEMYRRMVIMSEEYLYQWEKKHGPVPDDLVAEDYTPEEMGQMSDEQILVCCKRILKEESASTFSISTFK